jgi:hypothetical protein
MDGVLLTELKNEGSFHFLRRRLWICIRENRVFLKIWSNILFPVAAFSSWALLSAVLPPLAGCGSVGVENCFSQ